MPERLNIYQVPDDHEPLNNKGHYELNLKEHKPIVYTTNDRTMNSIRHAAFDNRHIVAGETRVFIHSIDADYVSAYTDNGQELIIRKER